MKILRLSAYFDPETTASTHLMNDLFEGFVAEKIYCQIITPTPTRGISEEVRKQYKSKLNEFRYDGFVEVNRFPMFRERKNPLLRAIRYGISSFYYYFLGTRVKDVDLVFSGSTPPINGLISILVAKKLSKKYKHKVSMVYCLQDIFPDSMVNSGLCKKGGFIWNIGSRLEAYTYKNSDAIIVISESMKENLLSKNVPEDKIELISNWIDLEKVNYISKSNNKLFDEFGINRDDFIVLYAGNFGAAQGADIILKAASKMKDYKNIKFVIFGGGSQFEEIKNIAKSLDNVFISGLLPVDRVSEVYSMGDVALITCKKGTGNAGLPSKLWSIMSCNVPIIASFDTDSDLNDVLVSSKSGLCVEPENEDALVQAILHFYYKNGLNIGAREFVMNNASKDICVQKYVNLIKRVYKANE